MTRDPIFFSRSDAHFETVSVTSRRQMALVHGTSWGDDWGVLTSYKAQRWLCQPDLAKLTHYLAPVCRGWNPPGLTWPHPLRVELGRGRVGSCWCRSR